MVNFGEAIANGFKNYVNFTGRSTRAEYWFWVLFVFLVSLVASILDAIIFGGHMTQTYTQGNGVTVTNRSLGSTSGPIGSIVTLAILIPSIALAVRRLRDAAHHWAWIFIGLIPIVGQIVLIVFYCQQTSPQGHGQPTSPKNPYGGGSTGGLYTPYPGQ